MSDYSLLAPLAVQEFKPMFGPQVPLHRGDGSLTCLVVLKKLSLNHSLRANHSPSI